MRKVKNINLKKTDIKDKMEKFVVIKENEEEDASVSIDSGKNSIENFDIRMIKEFVENKMTANHFKEIIKIIKLNEERYTKNNNGYFINLKNLNEITLLKIRKFINFVKENDEYISVAEHLKDEERMRIETIDKKSNIENFEDECLDKLINFEIFSLDGVKSEIFSEYAYEEGDEHYDLKNEEQNGYKINLKKYKKKYTGTKAKVLKRFKDISKSSINSRTIKNNLIVKTKVVKKDEKKKKEETTDVNEETTNYEDDTVLDDEEEDDEEEENED